MPKSKSESLERAVDLLLDSGAFSAWKKGEQIDLRAYIRFVEEHCELLHAYVNLDVIPGRPGRAASPTEVEEAAAESFRNYEKMRKAGLDPIPVYHLGEREDWLRRILDSGAGWIGLGGSVGKSDQARYQFFSRSFRVIGTSKVKVHGFGATSVWHLFKFPWYSVDSTSWVMPGINGAVLVPSMAPDGGFDYTALTAVRVSGQGKQERQAAGFGDLYRAHFEAFLTGEQSSLARVRSDQAARNYINIRCLIRVAEAAKVRMFFSTWLKAVADQALPLTAAGARNRLLSYYELRKSPADLEKYVTLGGWDSRRPRPFSVNRLFGRAEYRARRIGALTSREGS